MTNDSDSVVAREQSLQATEKYLPPESHRIGSVAPWERYWMSGLESTIDEPVVIFQDVANSSGCKGVPADVGAVAAWPVYVWVRKRTRRRTA